jgi:hypothetical protein
VTAQVCANTDEFDLYASRAEDLEYVNMGDGGLRANTAAGEVRASTDEIDMIANHVEDLVCVSMDGRKTNVFRAVVPASVNMVECDRCVSSVCLWKRDLRTGTSATSVGQQESMEYGVTLAYAPDVTNQNQNLAAGDMCVSMGGRGPDASHVEDLVYVNMDGKKNYAGLAVAPESANMVGFGPCALSACL